MLKGTKRERATKRIPGPVPSSASTVPGAFTSALLFNVANPKWSEPRPGQKSKEEQPVQSSIEKP